MKKLTSIFIVFLLAISFAYADGYPAEEAEHWEKVRQMDQLAKRFKAETGFIGRVDRDNQRSCLSYIRGNFIDVSFSDLVDTLAMRQELDAVIEKILPYIGIEGFTLTKTFIDYNTTGTSSIYRQLVHGYSFEHSGEIIIGYSRDSDDVTISNGIVYTSIPPAHVKYTFAQAVEIARQHYISVFGYPDTLSFKKPKKDDPPVIGNIIYETIKCVGTKYVYDKGKYRLCHIFGISVPYGVAGYRVAYIDAQTGEVYKIIDDSIEFTNCNAQGQVYSNSATPTTSYENMPNIRVVNPPSSTYYTDQEGACTIVDEIVNPGILSYMFSRDNADPNVIDYQFTLYADSTHVRHSDRRDLTLNPIELYYDDDDSYSPNVYYHLLAQHNGLLRFAPTFKPDTLTVISGCENTGNAFGQYWPSCNKIRIKKEKGKYSHIIRHELSHAYVYKTLGRHLCNDDTGTVEEALADYLACSISGTSSMEYGETSSISSIANITVNRIISDLGWTCFDEEMPVFDRRFSYPIASALWEIRNSLGMHNNVHYYIDNLIDKTLYYVIKPDQSSYDDSLSACPRYLFNSLMSRAGESANSWQLNPTQEVIRDGFHSRGLYFLPSVASTNDVYTDSVNVYIPGSVVHSKIRNYIQDSPIDVYVVNHQQDRYTGAFSDSVLIRDLPVVLGPIRVNTDMQGVAKLAITGSESLLPGEYDIIADCGYIYPDSTVYLNFSKRNVLDAIDGMDAPGFIISSWGDVAVALDLSSSMQGYANHLGKTVKALVQSMIPGERINAFGFTEGTANQNWIENGYVDLIGNEGNYFVNKEMIDTTVINSVLNSVVIEGNTDLVLPFHYGDIRLSALGNIGNRKNIILLSDGVHFVTPTDPDDFPEYPGNWTHTIGFVDTLITTVVVPDSIRCYTICYGDDLVGISNMRDFATLGNGALYHVEQLGDMKLILYQLLCSIRGTAAVVNSIKGIEPGMVQAHEIMVEPQASELRIVVIGKADSGGGAISYTLVSPSGVLFSPVENAGVCEIRNPESGIWIARVTNNTSSASSYSILGDTRSDINLAVTPPPVSHSIEKPLLISASLKKYCTPITNSSVN